MDFNDKKEYARFINDLILAKNSLSLVCFIGAGVPISQGYPTWDQYVKQLINYWTFHLNELVSHDDTLMKNVRLEDINVLENLLGSSGNNKRKVDMVNYIVRKYCETAEDSLTEKVYSDHVLDFEKFLFSDVSPVIQYNEVLEQLVKLRSCFITTNYDEQIEKSYERVLGTRPEIFPDIQTISGNIKTETIIHLHGIPRGNNDLFISSSKSYSNLYYKQNEYRKKIKELFYEKDNPLILFIGCSMEEDEILSILDLEDYSIKFYSLMKYSSNHHISQVNERENLFMKDYYKDQHNVKFMWYGDNFSNLPNFVKIIVEDIKKEETATVKLPKDVRRILLDE